MIRVEQDKKVRRIRLAAAERRNIIDAPMSAALLGALAEAQADSSTGAVLIEADGQIFCGGASPDADPGIYRIVSTKPIVASVQGVALGAGLALIAAAHVAFAAQGSSFGFVDIREGRWNQDLFEILSRCLGARRALELGLMGRIFTAPDALSWGLIHYLTPVFELDDRATSLAHVLAGTDPNVMRQALAGR